MSDLAVITCHFNFVGFINPRRNLHRFLLQMRTQGVPVYGVEAYLPGQVPQTAGIPGWRQIELKPDQILFQKEALLNLAEKLVPENFTKIAWVDADLWFHNPDWYAETSQALDIWQVVQMFDWCDWAGPDGRIVKTSPGSAFGAVRKVKNGHPGFAWAARRELWKIGLYERGVLGSGDAMMTNVFLFREILPREIENDLLNFMLYRSRVHDWLESFHFVPGRVSHEWHGSLQNRRYTERRDLIRHLDIASLAAKADNGLMRWTGPVDGMMEYFVGRAEDATG